MRRREQPLNFPPSFSQFSLTIQPLHYDMTLLLGLPIQEFSFLHFLKLSIRLSPCVCLLGWGGVEGFGILPTLLVTPIFFSMWRYSEKGWGVGFSPSVLSLAGRRDT